MIGEFLTRILILFLGYAYPGFECFKTLEKNRVQIEELRFWCQYWILVALITVLERFADIFVGWLPLYGEMKVVFFVYLWYPKTKGTAFVYQTFLRPYVSRHESEIDRQLMEWRAKGWDMFSHYWQIFAKSGHSAFFQALEYVATQSVRLKVNPNAHPRYNPTSQDDYDNEYSQKRASFESRQNTLSGKDKKWPPSPPPSPSLKRYTNPETPKYKTVKTPRGFQAEDDEVITPRDDEGFSKDALNQARARLRRLNTGSPGSPHA